MIGVVVGVGDGVGLSNVECDCTLGSVSLSIGASLGTVVGTFDGVSTLGDGVGGFGSFSTLLSVSVIFCRAMRAGYPASKLGIVVEGGAVRMVVIFVATCLKKSSKSTFRLGVSPGKKATVSTSLINFVG